MKRTWKPTTAGILSIIAAAVGIGGGILLMAAGGFVGQWGRMWGEMISEAMGVGLHVIAVAGAVVLTFGIIALIGGIYAIRRRAWGLALAGAILAVPVSGPLGVLAIIFVALSKKEFE